MRRSNQRPTWRPGAAWIALVLSACAPAADTSATLGPTASALTASSSGVCEAIVALPDAAPPERAASPLPTSSMTGNSIVAEVASYQLVANQPGRLLVALLTADNRWVSFGSVGVSFAFLGDAVRSPSPGVVAGTTAPDAVMGDSTAQFLAIPGSPEGIGRGPTLTLPADGRGVYAVEPITFPRAGYWRVGARGQLGDASPLSARPAVTAPPAPSR